MVKSLQNMTLDDLYDEQRRLVDLPESYDAQNAGHYADVMEEIDSREMEMS